MSTRIHHLNCATMRPVGSLGGRMMPGRFVAHCLLVEGDQGLTLVDSGFGTADIADRARLGRPFVTALRPALDPAEAAVSQVRALGFDPADVSDIVLTHLDLDHAGGIGDFPHANVHVFDDELAAATHPTVRERARYVQAQWAHGPNWVEHSVDGDAWFGFESARVLSDDVLLIPLRGHTRGHCGVAVRRPSGGWLLHAGDSYFFEGEKEFPPVRKPGLTAFQKLMAASESDRVRNQARLQELYAASSGEVTIFSAHDEREYAALAGATAGF